MFLKMEDDLIFFNGRQHKFLKMEDNSNLFVYDRRPNFVYIEDDLNFFF